MLEWFTQTAGGLTGLPAVQGILAACCTFVLEDPTTVGSGLLVAAGTMNPWAAFIGLTLGISLGDFGLYWLGRLARGRSSGMKFLKPETVSAMQAWYGDNLVSTVVTSRFLPGARLPTYLAAGALKVGPIRFLAVAVAASVVWTALLLTLTIHVGRPILDHAGWLRWPLGLALVGGIAWLQLRAAKKRRQAVAGKQEREPLPEKEEPVVSAFEFWPPALFYAPVFLYCLVLAARHRGLLLPTAANPSIFSGGLIGESKSAILGLAKGPESEKIAAWALFRQAPGINAEEAADAAEKVMKANGLAYPVVVKPDVGQRGAGVRPVRSREDLVRYLAVFPRGEGLILQRMVEKAREAGIFYCRRPGEETGHIFSITLKILPRVMGDGRRTLKELILSDPRARLIAEIYLSRHREQLDRVLAPGETFPLVFAGNHARGAVFKNGNALATQKLARALDRVAKSMQGFYIGRFDVMFGSLEGLVNGEDFSIVEVNGAGSEATHIWDANETLAGAYGTLFTQFRLLYEIGAHNRALGHKPMRLLPFAQTLLHTRRKLEKYPQTA